MDTLNLYLVENTKPMREYNYTSYIVCCKTEHQAYTTHPSGEYKWDDYDEDWKGRPPPNDWCDPFWMGVKTTLLGTISADVAECNTRFSARNGVVVAWKNNAIVQSHCFNDIYDKLLNQEKSGRLLVATMKIKAAKEEYERIQAETFTDIYKLHDVKDWNYPPRNTALTDIDDQRRILKNMDEDGIFKNMGQWIDERGNIRFNINSLLLHIDNIRCAYDNAGRPCPKWYAEKYQEFLKK